MILIFAVHVELLDTLYGELFLLEPDLVGAWCKVLRKLANVVGESGRKENNLTSPRDGATYPCSLQISKSSVKYTRMSPHTF